MTQTFVNIWRLVYDDDPEAGNEGGGDPTPDVGLTGTWSDDQKKEIEKIVKSRLDRVKKQNEPIIQELEKLKSLTTLTEQEKVKLQEQIKEIERSTMSKAELAAKERKEAEAKHAQEVDSLRKDAETWRTRYKTETIQRAITDAAATAKAFNPSQIVALLEGRTRLVEKTEDGQDTGVFETRVTFDGRDKDGKSIKMDLTVAEAVAEMQKMEDIYGNLFESGLKGGLGKNNTPGQKGPLTMSVLSSQEEYRKHRAEIAKVKV